MQVLKPSNRPKWDKNILRYDINKTTHKNLEFGHIVNKMPLGMYNRDFVDKSITFSHEGAVYLFCTAMNNDTEYIPIQSKTERAQNLINHQKFYRRPEDGKVVYQIFLQNDLKAKTAAKMSPTFFPGGIFDWFKKMSKHLNDHYSSI